MSIYETPSQLPILAAMLPGAVIWDAETTATAADPYPGPATPARGTELVWSPSGDVDTVASVVEVRVERNGYPGGALAVQQRLTGADDWNGWDAPTSVGYVEPVDWTASSVNNAYPSICALPDGRVVIVSEDTSDHTLRIIVREPDGTLEGPQEAIVVNASSEDVCPAVVATGDGFVRIYVWVAYARDELAQIWVYEAADDATSEDLADGTAWSLVVSDALDAPLDGSGAWPRLTRAAVGGGQVCIVYRQGSTIQQLYSADGYRFTAASTAITGEVGHSLAYEAGSFVMVSAVTATNRLVSRTVANAATPLSTSTSVLVLDGLGNVDSDTQTALTGDGAGNVWLYLDGDGSVSGFSLALVSSDGGQSWDDVGSSWGVAGNAPDRSTAACWWRDRALLVSRATAATGYTDALVLLHMGGWTDYALPRRMAGPTKIAQRVAWNATWLPLYPTSSALTPSGAATTGFTNDGRWSVVTSGAQTHTLTGPGSAISISHGACVGLEVTAGTVTIEAQYGDGVNITRAALLVTSTGLDLRDAFGGSLATATVSGRIEVLLWVDTGQCVAYYRPWTAFAPRAWTQIGATETLTTSASAAVGFFRASSANSTTVKYSVFKGFYQSAIYSGELDKTPTGILTLGRGTTAPGLPVSGTRQYLANGIYARAARGPGRVGDSWTIEAASPFGTEYAAWTAENNSPARAWQSTGVATEALAWEFADDPIKMEPLWAIHWRGDVQAIWYSWHNGTTWGSETSAVSYLIRSCIRYGSRLVINSGTSGAFVQADELVGGFAVDADDKARRIVANTAGVAWQGSSTLASTVITIESDGTERTSSSSWRIVWPQGVAIVNPPSTAQGLRVRVAVSGGIGQTPTGKHSLKVLAGPCVVLGLPHGNDTQMEHEAQPRSFEAPNGRRRTAQAAPARRVVTLTWQSTLDRLWQVQGYSGNEPDAIAWDTLPLYSRGEAASTLRACVERWAADGTPVLYLPRVDITGESATFPQTWVQHRAGGVIVGTLDPLWTVEGAGRGLEQNTEIVRLGALTITELT